jgi:hypothetical protein
MGSVSPLRTRIAEGVGGTLLGGIALKLAIDWRTADPNNKAKKGVDQKMPLVERFIKTAVGAFAVKARKVP